MRTAAWVNGRLRTRTPTALKIGNGGYRRLIVEVVKFFQTGVAPVSADDTLEVLAFMEAADESKRQGGKPVSIEQVIAKAREKESP